MNQLAEPYALAFTQHQAGQMADAERGYRRVLAERPDHVDALHYLGVLLHQRGDHEEAARLMDRALSLALDASACWSNRGLVAVALGDLPHAVECYERALALDPEFSNARNNLGVALQKQGHFIEAIEQHQLLLAQDPNFFDSRLNLGSTFAAAKRFDEALATYEEALRRDPNSFDAHFGKGNALRELKRFDESVASLHKALALRPNHFEARVNLGTTLGLHGKFVDAEKAYRHALTLRDDPQIHVCVGASLGSQGFFEEEEKYYRHALSIDPDHADAQHNLALLQLRRGNFKEGWALHEVRWRSSKYKPMNIPGVPEWSGEPLQGKTLLIAGEQGHGDMIQFARYASVLEQMGATVDMWVPENIMELVQTVRGIRHALHVGSTREYDYWTPSMSVPFHVGHLVPDALADVPYMSLSAERIGMGPTRVDQLAAGRRKVGIVWAGSPTFGNDQFRSMPFAAFSPMADLKDIAWFSLQKGAAREQLSGADCALKPYDLTDTFNDFADTAAFINQLDLVITVDTSVAHVAGALGKPVWVFLPANNDWRWMANREDSVWYPSARLFKQTTLGDWTGPVLKAKAALLAG